MVHQRAPKCWLQMLAANVGCKSFSLADSPSLANYLAFLIYDLNPDQIPSKLGVEFHTVP